MHISECLFNISRSYSSAYSMVVKCLRALSGLFSPNLSDQLSCRILTTGAKTRLILHDDWSIRLGENRPDRVLKHLAATLVHMHLVGWSTLYEIRGMQCYAIQKSACEPLFNITSSFIDDTLNLTHLSKGRFQVQFVIHAL